MARYKRGDIVVLPFPFSDASSAKPRPCLVVAELLYLGGTDYLVCMISSQKTSDPHNIELQPSDLVTGRLTVQSYLWPLYLFGAEGDIIVWRIGTLNPIILSQITKILVSVVNP